MHQCLSLTPEYYLDPAFSSLKFISSSIKQVQASQRQLETLVQMIAQLLQAINAQCRAGRLPQTGASESTALTDLCRSVKFTCQANGNSYLCRLLDDISAFAQKAASSSFLKLLFTEERRNIQIDSYYRRIGRSIEYFHVSCNVFHTHSLTQTETADINTARYSCMADKEWHCTSGWSFRIE